MMARKGTLIAGTVVALLASAAEGQQGREFAPLDIHHVERVVVDQVDPGVGGERIVELYFRALTKLGAPVENLRLVDVEVREDGRAVDREDILEMTTIQQTDLGVACVLTLDTSRTMIGPPFARAKDAAIRLLDRLRERDSAAVVTFSSSVEVAASLSDTRGVVRDRLDAMQIDRDAMFTVLYDGIVEAAALLRRPAVDRPRRSFLIVFSDGRDGGSTHRLEEAIRFANGDEGRSRIPVFTVGYAGRGGAGLDVLRRIASETGGGFSQASDAEAFYEAVLRQMRATYRIRYRSEMDGRSHVAEVAVEGRSDARSAAYPDITRTPWWWAIAAGVVVVALLVVAVLARGAAAGTLRVVEGPLNGARFPLRRGRNRIGSLEENDVVIDAPAVSRHHAEIRVTRGAARIEDLASTNGTLVNGVPVESSSIQPGDRIRLGDVDMVFER